VAALEARVVAEVSRALSAQLDAIADDLIEAAPRWKDDPATALRDRRALAARIRKVRPGAAAVIRSALEDAVRAGAGADTDIEGIRARDDDLVDRMVRSVDAAVRAKASVVARHVTQDPARTDAQTRRLAERVRAVASPARAAASTAVVRAADLGSVAAADGGPRTWITRPDACVHCVGYAGAVATPPEHFRPVLEVRDRALPWAADGVPGPPLHAHCRCVAVPATQGLPRAVQKAAAVDVAAGRVGYASGPARARAAERLARSRAPITAATRRKARRTAKSA
jgi:hypothetical protein